MKRISLLLLAFALAGCMTSLMPQTPQTRMVVLQGSPDVAYQHALTTMQAMGGTLTLTDPRTHTLSAQVHGAVVLHVNVVPRADASDVTIRGTLLPGKLALGSFDEVDDYATRLQQGQ